LQVGGHITNIEVSDCQDVAFILHRSSDVLPLTSIESADLPGTTLDDINAPQQLGLQLGALICECQTLPQVEE